MHCLHAYSPVHCQVPNDQISALREGSDTKAYCGESIQGGGTDC